MPALKSDEFYPHLVKLDWMRVKPFIAIVVHHSATTDNPKGYSWNAIRDYHMKDNGWSDIGYHFGTELVDGKPVYLLGRSMYEYGAHAVNWNTGNHAAIGLCVVGNFGSKLDPKAKQDGIDPPEEIWSTAAYMCMALRRVFKEIRKTDLQVIGHRETYAPKPIQKSCPGWRWDMDRFRKEVFGGEA